MVLCEEDGQNSLTRDSWFDVTSYKAFWSLSSTLSKNVDSKMDFLLIFIVEHHHLKNASVLN